LTSERKIKANRANAQSSTCPKTAQGRTRTARNGRFLSKYYFKPLHNLPVYEITRDQIQTRIDDIAVRSGPASAEACYSMIAVFFKWALKTGKLPGGHHNPTVNVRCRCKKGRANVC
jgi:hypothetical protein